MTDIVLTEKLYESIVNKAKKTELFEKLGNFKFYINSFLIITSLIGVTSICINILTRLDISYTKKNIKKIENTLKYEIEINGKHNSINYIQLKLDINKQLSLLLENQKIIIKQLEEAKLINNSEENSLPINTFAPIKFSTILNDNYLENDIKNSDEDYDELLNECYDTMPLNNLKKNTGLYWLFK
jgi:hypothetical protein